MSGRILPALAVLLGFGCSRTAPEPLPEQRPFEGVRLRVLVPDRPGLGTWLQDRRGEWEARTGAAVVLVQSRADASSSAAAPGGDVLFFPSTGMGRVVDGGRVLPLPRDLVEGERYGWRDIPPVLRDHLLVWQRQPCGVPILAGCWLVYYRRDLFQDPALQRSFQERYGQALQPADSWEQFDRLAQFFDGKDLNGDGQPDSGLAVAGWAEAFLCRAAAYGKYAQNLSFYFDINTMEPLLGEPPFRQALTEWQRVARLVAQGGGRGMGPFLDGRAAMALGSSLQAAAILMDPRSRVAAKVACAPLPGSRRVYDFTKGQWVELPERRYNRVAIVEGWLGAVVRGSRHSKAAFDFLAYLTGRETSLVTVPAPEFNLGPFRVSHFSDVGVWAAAKWPASVASLLAAEQQSLAQPDAVALLRIDGAERFRQALSRQLQRALGGRATAEQALGEATDGWQKLLDELGRQRLLRQYRRSLGMPVID